MSCASKISDNDIKTRREKDLLQEFSLNEDTFEKFRVREEVTSELPPEKEKQLPKKVEKKNKKLVKKKIIKSKGIEKVQTEKIKEIYPEDYPEELKKLDKVSKKFWKDSKPLHILGEEMTFQIHYLGINIGSVKMSSEKISEINGKKTYFLKAHLRSADYYSFIYSLDDAIESYVDSERFLPIKYSLIQRESKQEVDDLQLFDFEKLKTYHWYRRLKDEKIKKDYKESYIPQFFQDSYSVFLFLRGLPLKIGNSYEIPIVNRGTHWILKIKVSKHENIRILDKKIPSIVLKAESYFPGIMKKKGDITLWYSQDDKKILLKFKAKIKLGSIQGDLVKYQQ